MLRRITALFLFTAVLLGSLCGCALFAAPDPEENFATITIVYPDSSETVKVEYYRKTDITPRHQSEKILIGYYAQNSAVGIEYFTSSGKMNQSWEDSFPTTIYAVYQDADYSTVFTSDILKEENPFRTQYYEGVIFSFPTHCTSQSATATDEYFSQLLYSNPTAEIRITLYADLKADSKYYTNSYMKLKIGNDPLESKDLVLSENNYTTISLSTVVKAKQLIANENNVVKAHIDNYTYIKNIYYTIEFVNK